MKEPFHARCLKLAGEVVQREGSGGAATYTRPILGTYYGGEKGNELSLWDLRTAKRTVGLTRKGGIMGLAISPDGSRICVATEDAEERLVDAVRTASVDRGDPDACYAGRAVTLRGTVRSGLPGSPGRSWLK